jgi:hypothetical protein
MKVAANVAENATYSDEEPTSFRYLARPSTAQITYKQEAFRWYLASL